ncbi:MAG: hypothetical protein A2X82_17185 [Geobacteraceae bacterium GWC2_55_20]|nr:MAG: hypothetical protein A2X82_17185 [Geobacteraceae bacterium GWC2_55_20]OGU26254.1 MAG: hypothetical protein A2X85_01885 [Geobacteraceae bacterium GWF2_54_21]HBA72762.1 phage tail protein [Geobacter sp.]
MSDCYTGEIRMFGGTFAPMDWAFCDGSVLEINQYSALFALIGTTYGGDGTTTFKLPDLRGRLPLHMGQGAGLSNRPLATAIGTETETLDPTNIPAHNHLISTGGDGTTAAPNGNYPGNSVGFSFYSNATPDSVMNASTVGMSSSTAAQPHSNVMPALCVNFIIALSGYFPTRD